MKNALLRLLIVGLLMSATLRPGLCAQPWNPGHTWVFVVGILQWKDSETWPSFPQTDRRDAQLVKLLESRGVPADRVVYLQDRAATHAHVIQAFHNLLARSQPGDELIVYFCGHGWRNDAGVGYFALYDAGDDMDATAWKVSTIPADVDAQFKGSRALLLADCCYSGTLAEAVEAAHGHVAMACLASSSSSIESTGAWTFSESILQGFSGSPVVDLNHDGKVSLEEMQAFTRAEMAFADEQKSESRTTDGYDRTEVVAAVSGQARPRQGEHVEVNVDKAWWKARVLASRGNEVQVHYYGYEVTDDAWVPLTEVRNFTPKNLPVGTHVQVLWKKKWYPAVVLQADQGIHFVHYEGFDSKWDEWVDSRHIKTGS